jgi:hypothetical protein
MNMNNSKNSSKNGNSSPVSRYANIGFTIAPHGEVSWNQVECDVICDLVKYVTCAGDAVMFGLTKQGGLSVTIYNEGLPIKIYSNSVVDMTAKCIEATAAARLVIPQEVLSKIERQ